jgi:hypothetical protein
MREHTNVIKNYPKQNYIALCFVADAEVPEERCTPFMVELAQLCGVRAWKAQSVYRLAAGWTTRGRSSSPGRLKTFLHVVQTGSWAHPALIQCHFLGNKRPWPEANHVPLISAELKKTRIYPRTP